LIGLSEICNSSQKRLQHQVPNFSWDEGVKHNHLFFFPTSNLELKLFSHPMVWLLIYWDQWHWTTSAAQMFSKEKTVLYKSEPGLTWPRVDLQFYNPDKQMDRKPECSITQIETYFDHI